MGWVTLTLRKRELKQQHAIYQLRDLQISREKRQLARQRQYETAVIQNEQKQETTGFRKEYYSQRNTLREQIATLRQEQKDNGKNDAGNYNVDNSSEISSLQQQMSDAQLEYQEKVNDAKDIYDQELAMVEEDASDRETELDMEQSDIEAQMEAISQEIQSVSDAVSTEIQNSTIKLA